MEKRFVFRFSFFDLKNENEKTNRFSFILLNFLHVEMQLWNSTRTIVRQVKFSGIWSRQKKVLHLHLSYTAHLALREEPCLKQVRITIFRCMQTKPDMSLYNIS